MNRQTIESNAHSVHREIWMRRKNLWPLGEPDHVSMLDPRIAARILDIEYEVRESIGGNGSREFGAQAGGLIDLRRGVLAVSAKFKYEVQRFTAAHEIGHLVLHPWIGDGVVHRDIPVSSTAENRRSQTEQEADFFAACFLMPKRLVETEFAARFGSKIPLPKTETVAFHLRIQDMRTLFSAPRSSMLFANHVANAESFDTRRFPSLAKRFGVSVQAMAIRLRELGLVEE